VRLRLSHLLFSCFRRSAGEWGGRRRRCRVDAVIQWPYLLFLAESGWDQVERGVRTGVPLFRQRQAVVDVVVDVVDVVR